MILTMKIIIRREEGFEKNHYCILEFSGRFEGDEEESSLQRLVEGKNLYKIEMGSNDIVGWEDEKFQDHFLYTESEKVSSEEKIITVKGIVSKRIVFNKRPSPNLGRINEKPREEKYSMFKSMRN